MILGSDEMVALVAPITTGWKIPLEIICPTSVATFSGRESNPLKVFHDVRFHLFSAGFSPQMLLFSNPLSAQGFPASSLFLLFLPLNV
jgi:hypothetical protein